MVELVWFRGKIEEQRIVYIFFFQAEDGIRDLTVTGVQTCALPISAQGSKRLRLYRPAAETTRYARQGQRQSRLRHRRDAARHDLRNCRRLPRVRRQDRKSVV